MESTIASRNCRSFSFCERVKGSRRRSFSLWLLTMVKVWLFLLVLRELPLAERRAEPFDLFAFAVWAGLADLDAFAGLADFADLVDFAGLADFALLTDLEAFDLCADAAFFAAGALRAAAFFGAAFFAGFFGADFLVERAIKLMVGVVSLSVRN
ncbi:MAG TPA: hypothetical protein VGF73_01215 [Chthoniobacterales bacterium]